LKHAWAWKDAPHLSSREAIEAAVKDTREECLVMRVLRHCWPHHVETLERLKTSEPVIVVMNE